MQFKAMLLPVNKQCHCQGAVAVSAEAVLPRLAIDASVLKQKLEGAGRPLLIDVRRLDEYRAMRFSNCLHVPLESFADHLSEIKEAIVAAPEVVFYCRSGVRSKTAINLVHQALSAGGFDLTKIPPLYNLSGGILQWYRLHQDSCLESDAKG
jgi:adenylyltransferase/sulfurtransferase